MCGEYGDHCVHGVKDCEWCGHLHRPHYHAILFNCWFHDLAIYKNEDGYELFTSPSLSRLWGKGFVTVGEVSYDSAAYVASYCLKKITGVQADSHYEKLNLHTGEIVKVEPEYCTMSRRPGIGREWYEKYKEDVFPSDEVPVVGKGVIKKAPRYYETILQSEDLDTYEEVKRIREVFRKEHEEEYTGKRLLDKYRCTKAQLKLKETRRLGYDAGD